MLCSSGAPNLSLWAFLATALPSPDNKHAFGAAARAASARQPPAPLKKKVYVTFQTNEGAKNAFSSHIYALKRSIFPRQARYKHKETLKKEAFRAGDTPKIVAGLFGGTWLSPQRGSTPVVRA